MEETTVRSKIGIKVKTGDLASDVFDFFLAHFAALLKLARFPLLASFLVFIVADVFPGHVALSLTSTFIEFCAMAVFAVAVHRFYLLDAPLRLAMGVKEIKFILFTFATAFIWIVPMTYASLVFENSVEAMHNKVDSNTGLVLLSFLAVVIGGYVVLRLSLVFPLIAIEKPGSFVAYVKCSWVKMKGNVLPLFLALFVLMFVISLFSALPELVLGALDPSGTSQSIYVFRSLIGLALGFINSLFLVLIASYIFKRTMIENAGPSGVSD